MIVAYLTAVRYQEAEVTHANEMLEKYVKEEYLTTDIFGKIQEDKIPPENLDCNHEGKISPFILGNE